MSRKPRQETTPSEGFYHVVSRGNNQQKIFKAIRDYQKLLKILKETKKKYPFFLYSYSLIPNHYHLALETKEFSLSKIMHQINSSYVRYFRHRYGGSGHLFQERFFSSLVDKDSYLKELICYIDLNSIRAGLARNPEDYRWSSCSVYLKQNYSEDLIDKEKFLSYIGEDLKQAGQVYLEFIKDALRSKKEAKEELEFLKF